ncbi:hypothetical protein Ddye_031482 [Dipteronia dyeriana]|uniref:Reverse transcriptase domain-containing protein n=1 Tax=Dipteronia dyeriana TaxID=168575 RepID=A0AAD9WNR8_9ROSI|nr:hypothetical protein Ddye_031482 [Dipteronia dyeriana]
MVSSNWDSSSSDYGPGYKSSVNPFWQKGEAFTLRLKEPIVSGGLAGESNNTKSQEGGLPVKWRNKSEMRVDISGHEDVDKEMNSIAMLFIKEKRNLDGTDNKRIKEGAMVESAFAKQGIEICVDMRERDSDKKGQNPCKILAKVLANQMRKVIHLVIGDSQMDFVKNRQILDSFVIEEEIIHHWKNSKKKGLLIKLDFEKAYDSLDHVFLDHMLHEIGFGCNWHQWIGSCVSTPTVSVLVNGSPTREFRVKRGLRQGDPLSPFLFNVAVEGLTVLLRKTASMDMLKGIFFGDETVHVLHLQFADDTILFLQPKTEYLRNARRIFRCFELAYGLSLNFNKSCVVHIETVAYHFVNTTA